MFSDPQFWVAVAFVIFIIAIFNPVRKILTSTLDTKINNIKKDIEEAENLKDETQLILSDIKKRQNEVELEVKQIHLNSKERIKILESESKEKLNQLIEKKESLAETKMEHMIRDTKLSVQQHISQIAIESAIAILKNKINQEEKQNLINESIEELRGAIKN